MIGDSGMAVSLRTFCHGTIPPLVIHPTLVPPLANYTAVSNGRWVFDPALYVSKCCVFPFISPYIPNEKRQSHIASLKGKVWRSGSSSLRPAFIGVMEEFRVCCQCLSDDFVAYGKAYLHRSHHLMEIPFCLVHKTKLRFVGNTHTLTSTIQAQLHKLGNRPSQDEKFEISDSLLKHLRESVEGLLDRPIVPSESLDFRPLYRQALMTKGSGLRGNRHDLIDQLFSKYSDANSDPFLLTKWCKPRLLHYLGASVRHKTIPTIAHLILQHFLGISFAQAIKFSDGKLWQCPNPITDCGLAGCTRIEGIATHRAETHCEKCGFVATFDLRTPLGTKPKQLHILGRGNVFDSYVKEEKKRGTTVEELSAKTGMSITGLSVILYELQATSIVQSLASKQSNPRRAIALRDAHRKQFLEYRSKHPDASRSELKKNLRAQFLWLRDHDKDWYRQHAPPRERKKLPAWLTPGNPRKPNPS
jgi:hypothetical protein